MSDNFGVFQMPMLQLKKVSREDKQPDFLRERVL
jgi:hypothetical protein